MLDVVGTAKSWRNSSWWEIGLWIWCCSWSLHVAEEEKLVINRGRLVSEKLVSEYSGVREAGVREAGIGGAGVRLGAGV